MHSPRRIKCLHLRIFPVHHLPIYRKTDYYHPKIDGIHTVYDTFVDTKPYMYICIYICTFAYPSVRVETDEDEGRGLRKKRSVFS